MPGKRIPPSERIRKEILALIQNLGEGGSNQELLGRIVHLGMRQVVQELLEQEVKGHIGKGYYEHGKDRGGYRNGYKPAHLKTAEKKLPIEKPQVADSPDPFQSRVWSRIKGRTEELERIAVEMYARGCSTRDIEELLKDEEGRLLLSRSAVSQLNRRLWEEYEAFCKVDLSGEEVVYLFADAVYESLRRYRSRREGILVVWGVMVSGEKVLLSMKLGNKESHEDWLEVFRDLRKRGLNEPVLGTTDGAPGLIQAFEEAFPRSLRQRCLVHKKRNILNKVPQEGVGEVKLYLNAVYLAPDKEAAWRETQVFRDRFSSLYSSAVACFEEDLEACLAHLECPARHRRSLLSTNLVERSFLEENRRSKVIPRFFDEKSGLKLVFATLIRAARNWRRLPMGFEEQVQLMALRQKLGLKVHNPPDASKPRRMPQKQQEIFQKK